MAEPPSQTQKADECHAERCCVPLCSALSESSPNRLTCHRFPADGDYRRKWLDSIGKEDLSPEEGAGVCWAHFRDGDYENGEPQRKRLKPDAVPGLFPWNGYRPARHGVEGQADRWVVDTVVHDHRYGQVFSSPSQSKIQMELQDLKEQKEKLSQMILKERYGVMRFADCDDAIHLYTRFATYDHLMAFWQLIEPAAANIRYFSKYRKRKELAQPGRLPPLSKVDEFFMFMAYLVLGLEEFDLASCFMVEKSSVVTILTSWTDFLHRILGSVPMWLSKENVRAHLPMEFKHYPDTQVVVDFIELHCRTPVSLFPCEETIFYDELETEYTVKALVGMAPHGSVTFISAFFPGRFSDEEVFQKSGIIPLLAPDMSIMVDKGLRVKTLVPCKVHRLPFISKEKESVVYMMKRSTARLRAYIDVMFQRVRTFALFNQVIPLSTAQNLNQLFTVACMMVNYQTEPAKKASAEAEW
ncbi:uncharacterized protein LOC130131697 [Lampris incognitus]|uniref:uncharacterized protein LOC130131697 n=1 Tax=Lampris incognitus TaxID=2546036 RepID=UPI0024B616F0|nr:uncharacterized protein LOC130131697 [Lampris incognitus]